MNNPIATLRHCDKRKVIRFFTHLIVLAMLFFLPEVVLYMSRPRFPVEINWLFYVKPTLYCIAFYINYYYIIDHTLGRKFGIWRFLGLNLILLAVILSSLYLISAGFIPPPRHSADYTPHMSRMLGFFIRESLVSALSVALATALKTGDKWLHLDRKQQLMQACQREEELKSLKSQLNPHFLFNTLNSIYALIAISPDKAQKAVHDLSRLLRYVLYEDSPMVKLSQELDFIDNYIKLMRLRIGDKMPINVTLDPGDCGDCMTAPLLFISLVENAFKHGNTGSPDHSIDISVTCRGGIIDCHIANNHNPDDRSKDVSGIGIANLRRRLDIIYGSDAKMTTAVSADRYIVNLSINLNNTRQ